MKGESSQTRPSFEMEPVYQVTRRTVIYLAILILVCFLANFVLFFALSQTRTSSIRNELRTEMNTNISQKIDAIDVARRDTTHTFALNDFEDFLAAKKARGSEFFYCGGVPFFIKIRNHRYDWEDYLDISLVSFNPSDNYTYFMKTDFELRLLNVRNSDDRIFQAKHTFTNDKPERGKDDFIKTRELLYAFSNDFVQYDRLRVRVHLQCDPIRRVL